MEQKQGLINPMDNVQLIIIDSKMALKIGNSELQFDPDIVDMELIELFKKFAESAYKCGFSEASTLLMNK